MEVMHSTELWCSHWAALCQNAISRHVWPLAETHSWPQFSPLHTATTRASSKRDSWRIGRRETELHCTHSDIIGDTRNWVKTRAWNKPSYFLICEKNLFPPWPGLFALTAKSKLLVGAVRDKSKEEAAIDRRKRKGNSMRFICHTHLLLCWAAVTGFFYWYGTNQARCKYSEHLLGKSLINSTILSPTQHQRNGVASTLHP